MEPQCVVSVICHTYNQSAYIQDAMNGFTMQQTSFPYVCCVIDDASTDGEPEVINRYLEEHFDLEDSSIVRYEETDDYKLCYVRHKTNKNCFFAVFWLKYNHFGKKSKRIYYKCYVENVRYIAVCEGDDYWIDENKLQRQVDFLDTHKNHSAVAENGKVYNVNTSKCSIFNDDPDGEYNIDELLVKRRFPTASVMAKREFLLSDEYMNLKYCHDTMTWCYLASKGIFSYHNIVSSVYRAECGITATTNRYEWARTVEQWDRYMLDYFKSEIKESTTLNIEKQIYDSYLKAIVLCLSQWKLDDVKLCIKKLRVSHSGIRICYDVVVFVIRKISKRLHRINENSGHVDIQAYPRI